jgi:hypothetical protein
MKKTVLTYGLIAGIIASVGMGISLAIGIDHMDSVWGMILGFTGMIIAFAFIFVAIIKYRDRINNGSVSFGNAFLIGLGISLIASTMYVLVWMVEYKYVYPDFMEKYAAQTVENMRAEGVPASEIDQTAAEMNQFKEDYKNPWYRAAVTYTEILPIGILASILAAAILRRSKAVSVDS